MARKRAASLAWCAMQTGAVLLGTAVEGSSLEPSLIEKATPS
jgi:hypothetical protein